MAPGNDFVNVAMTFFHTRQCHDYFDPMTEFNKEHGNIYPYQNQLKWSALVKELTSGGES
jgi:hypothetical protein